ncbi:TRAP transporter substrate-binding protein DctP [Brevibacillus choshinensis]|uniref:TRAP transporter substrate-binding protein n=1 Tax=Brevibacillus choshinensis TaxID=54911 RepID=UPI002E1FB136|nr:TRAP transporter substrate-binding protein DctP [Brevibacillus choshinensis]MED4582803.1 TRAP transporter substrate-binding protein DctP [Brevibacillus choshinensis]MED4779914.1 TRAP transporter substrate-binding protein DctP [Brevibacillus choshinensis]
MKVRKKLLMSLCSVFSIAVLLASCGTGKGGGNASGGIPVIEMNVNNVTPSTHPYATKVFEPWKKLVEEKTNGRVQVHLYHGGTLGSSKSVLQDVKGGVYDVGPALVPYFYDTELFPFTIGNLPFAFPDAKSTAKVMGKFAEKYGKESFKDVVYMGMSSSDAYELFTVKPVKFVDDMKGKKVRIPSKGEVDLIQSWSGSPVSMTIEEIYEALQKGTLDAAIYTPSGAVGYKYYEVAPYMTKMGVTTTPIIPIMSKNFYNKLPDDLKKLFDDELSPKLADLLTDNYTKELDAAYAKYEKEVAGKGEIITLSSEELARFKAPAKKRWDQWVEEANKKGYHGEEMMNDFKKMLQEEGLQLPF